METFYRYKLKSASAGLNRAVQLHVDPRDANFRVQLMCVAGLFAIFLWSAWRQTAVRFWQLTVACALFLAWSIVPVLFAWGGAHTMVDGAYWSWATVLCAALASIEILGKLWRLHGQKNRSSGDAV
jgi:peptidoglycan/LPS O-acetylase OafA/YrhL